MMNYLDPAGFTQKSETPTPTPAPQDMMTGIVETEEQKKKRLMSKPMKKGGSVSSASKRADGCAIRGKTKGTIVVCGGGYVKGKK